MLLNRYGSVHQPTVELAFFASMIGCIFITHVRNIFSKPFFSQATPPSSPVATHGEKPMVPKKQIRAKKLKTYSAEEQESIPDVNVLESELKTVATPPSGKKTGVANPDFLKYFHENKAQFKIDNPTLNQFAARAQLYSIWKATN